MLDVVLDTRDVFWRRLSGFHDVPESIFRVHLLRYSGTTIRLSDGVNVNWGDPFVGVHLNNRKLMKLLRVYQPLERRERFLAEAHRELAQLVTYFEDHPPYDEAVAIRGRTILAYNFKTWPVDIFPLKRHSWFTRLYRWGLKVNLARWHPLRFKRLFSKNRKNLEIQDVWMSVKTLKEFAKAYVAPAESEKE